MSDSLLQAAEWEETEYPDGERDYSFIVQVLISCLLSTEIIIFVL